MPNDVINMQAFEITCSSEEVATAAKREIEHHTLVRMNGIIGAVLSELVEPGAQLSIDKIEIDLGDLTLDELAKNEVFEKFTLDFKKQILRHKSERMQGGAVTAQAASQDLELLRLLLAEADLPWWIAKTKAVDVNRRLQALLITKPAEMKRLFDDLRLDLAGYWRLSDFTNAASKAMIEAASPGYFKNAELVFFMQKLGNGERPSLTLARHVERFASFAAQSSRLSPGALRSMIFKRISETYQSIFARPDHISGKLSASRKKELEKKFDDALIATLQKLSSPQLEWIFFEAFYFEKYSWDEMEDALEQFLSVIAQKATELTPSIASEPRTIIEPEKATVETENRAQNPGASLEPGSDGQRMTASLNELSALQLLAGRNNIEKVLTEKQPARGSKQASVQALLALTQELILLKALEKKMSGDREKVETLIQRKIDPERPDIQAKITTGEVPGEALNSIDQPSSTETGEPEINDRLAKKETEKNIEEISPDIRPAASLNTVLRNPSSDETPAPAIPGKAEQQISFITKLLSPGDASIAEYLKHIDPALLNNLVSKLEDRKRAARLQKKTIRHWMSLPDTVIFEIFRLFLALSAQPASPDVSSRKVRKPAPGKRVEFQMHEAELQRSVFEKLTRKLKRKDLLTLKDAFEKRKFETADEKSLFEKIMLDLREENELVIEYLASLPDGEIIEASQVPVEPVPTGNLPYSVQIPYVNQKEGAKKIYLENAGLCLIAIYLPGIFKRLDYLEKSVFKNKSSASRALFLSQYLVTGKRKSPEYVLQLNKVLCGFSFEDAILTGIRLTNKETQEAGNLLASVIENWKALKNTSVDGFRDSFLQRKGILEEDELKWTLRVEKKGYDLLLNTIPWGYSLIKLPWMKKHLTVEW